MWYHHSDLVFYWRKLWSRNLDYYERWIFVCFIFSQSMSIWGTNTTPIKLLSNRFPFAADSYAFYFGRSFLIGFVAFTYSAAIMIYASIIITSCMYFESSIDDLIDSFHCIDATLSVRTKHYVADAKKELIEMIEYQISSVEWVEMLPVNIRNGMIRAKCFFSFSLQ